MYLDARNDLNDHGFVWLDDAAFWKLADIVSLVLCQGSCAETVSLGSASFTANGADAAIRRLAGLLRLPPCQ